MKKRRDDDISITVTVSVKKKPRFYPIFYGLRLVSPILVLIYGADKTYDICERLIRKSIEVKVVS